MSLRDVAQGAKVDHAYVYRLETGAKESPSGEVVDKLVGALTPSERDAKILHFLANHPNVETDLLEVVHTDADVSYDEFHMLTTVVNRGARADYKTSLARIRRFMGS